MIKISDPRKLLNISYQTRALIVKMLSAAGSGHTGASLGLADIFTCLYFNELNHNPENPVWPDRDRVILSIGHVAPVFLKNQSCLRCANSDQGCRGTRALILGSPESKHPPVHSDKDCPSPQVWLS